MVDYNSVGGDLECVFHGRIDTKAAEELEGDLLNNVQLSKGVLVFNFADLDYVASAFLRSCVKVARVAAPRRVKVVHASKEILHVFEMTGFDKLMEIER